MRYHTRTQQRPAARAAMDRDNMPWTWTVNDLWKKTENANQARERLAEASIIQLTWPTKVPGELELKYLLSALDECDRKFESARTNRRLFYRRLRNEPGDYGAPQLCECTLCNRTFSRHDYAQHEIGGGHQMELTKELNFAKSLARAGEARLRARALEKLIARALVRRAFIEHGLSAPREVERLIVQLANSEQ